MAWRWTTHGPSQQLASRSPQPLTVGIHGLEETTSTTMASIHPGTRKPSRAKYATAEDWARMKDIIIDLYENHTLLEVMAVMENDHGLRSTRRMFNARFKQWGANRKYAERVTTKTAVRKKKTGGAAVRALFTLDSEPVPGARGQVEHSPCIQRRRAIHSSQLELFMPPPAPGHGITADCHKISEGVLFHIHAYYEGSFASGIWTEKPRTKRGNAAIFLGHVNALPYLLEAQRNEEIGLELVSLSALTKDLVSDETPETVQGILTALRCLTLRSPEILQSILIQFRDMSGLVRGENHGLTRVFRHLAMENPATLFEITACGSDIARSGFISELGPRNVLTLISRRTHLNFFQSQDLSNDIMATRDLVDDMRAAKVHEFVYTLSLLTLAQQLSRRACAYEGTSGSGRADYEEAMSLAHDVIARSQNKWNDSYVRMNANAFLIQAWMHRQFGDWEQALAKYEEGLHTVECFHGRGSQEYAQRLIFYGQLLHEAGRREEANKVQLERLEISRSITDILP